MKAIGNFVTGTHMACLYNLFANLHADWRAGCAPQAASVMSLDGTRGSRQPKSLTEPLRPIAAPPFVTSSSLVFSSYAVEEKRGAEVAFEALGGRAIDRHDEDDMRLPNRTGGVDDVRQIALSSLHRRFAFNASSLAPISCWLPQMGHIVPHGVADRRAL